MFHLAANFVALADTANTDVPALNDGIMARQNNHHIPPEDMELIAAYSSCVTLLRTRLNNPKTRQVCPTFIDPVNVALLPPNLMAVSDFRDRPFVLRAQEEIVWESTDSAAGPNNHYILTWLRKRFIPAPIGDVYTMRGTGATTAVASAWTLATIAWDTQLPAGEYAVVGAALHSVTGVGFQLTFDNQFWRPGGLCTVAPGTRAPDWQRRGGLGVWGYFNTVTMPRVSVLCNAADTAQVVYCDVVRVR